MHNITQGTHQIGKVGGMTIKNAVSGVKEKENVNGSGRNSARCGAIIIPASVIGNQ
jgi:hypothetical protein